MNFKKLVKAEAETNTNITKRKTKIDTWIEEIESELFYIKPLIRQNLESNPNRGDIKSAITKKLQEAYSALLDIEDIF